jgi:hypothetical protein
MIGFDVLALAQNPRFAEEVITITSALGSCELTTEWLRALAQNKILLRSAIPEFSGE